jgi:hypothetical protein
LSRIFFSQEIFLNRGTETRKVMLFDKDVFSLENLVYHLDEFL